MSDDQKPTSRMQEALLTLLAAHDEEVAAVKNAPTRTTLATLAADYTYAVTDEQRATLAADVADHITLAEAGTIRRAAEAIKLGTPGVIAREAAAGTDTATIAAALGVTTSYVRRIIRDNRSMLADIIKARDAEGATGGHDWHHATPSAGLTCRRCALAHKNWSGDDCPATD